MTKEASINIETVRQASPEEVEQLRKAMMNIINENSSHFHPADVRRIQEDTAFCKRFIFAAANKMDHAVEIACKALEWRKSFGVNDFEENSPQGAACLRYLNASSIFPYGKTKAGATILMMRSRFHQKPRNAEERLEHQKLVAHLVEVLVMKQGVRRMALIFDCQHTGLSNTDIDGIKFIITLFRDYYPFILERIFVVELPWILQATWKLVRALLPAEAQKIIVFRSKAELKEDIDASNLPKWLDGNNEYCYKYVPGKVLGDMCPAIQKIQS